MKPELALSPDSFRWRGLAAAHAIADRKAHGRSRITNNKDLLPDVDQRSAAARRFRDLVRSFIADQGGIENVSAVRLGLLRRLAGVSVMSEQLEALVVRAVEKDALQGLITAGKFPLEAYCSLVSASVRLASRLGLERAARDVTPRLSDILRENAENVGHD